LFNWGFFISIPKQEADNAPKDTLQVDKEAARRLSLSIRHLALKVKPRKTNTQIR
jgi:hypothetical protein